MVAAGFHNAVLYEGLRSSIPPLVALLRDDEDKTRANAAGALGNLVRNSGLLCQSLIQANALQVSRILPDATLFLMISRFIQANTLQARRILPDAKVSLLIANSPKPGVEAWSHGIREVCNLGQSKMGPAAGLIECQCHQMPECLGNVHLMPIPMVSTGPGIPSAHLLNHVL